MGLRALSVAVPLCLLSCGPWLAQVSAGAPLAQVFAGAPTTPASVGPRSAPADVPAERLEPAHGLTAADVAVIINTRDALSQAIGRYYMQRRHIPSANLALVAFDPAQDELPAPQFLLLRRQIERQLPVRIQAYALTWARPYRVGCMSITAALAFGVNPAYCATGCTHTARSAYFNAPAASRPFDDLHLRLAMAISADSVQAGEMLIDRGIAADGTFPRGAAYLVDTGDKARSSRVPRYAAAAAVLTGRIEVRILHTPGVTNQSSVLFYFTGAMRVPDIGSNRFLPGAIADHVTSFGGMLTDSPQMSSMRWLEAGATASYGTVVEPCSFPEKFPDLSVLLYRYLQGDTLIEAYWKSVAMPGQGIFIGEPLAAPFRAR